MRLTLILLAALFAFLPALAAPAACDGLHTRYTSTGETKSTHRCSSSIANNMFTQFDYSDKMLSLKCFSGTGIVSLLNVPRSSGRLDTALCRLVRRKSRFRVRSGSPPTRPCHTSSITSWERAMSMRRWLVRVTMRVSWSFRTQS